MTRHSFARVSVASILLASPMVIAGTPPPKEAPAKAAAPSIAEVAAKLAYPGTLGKFAMRKRALKKEAAGHEAAVAAGSEVMKTSQNDIYATKDQPEKVMAYYHDVLSKMGYTNDVPKSAAGPNLNAGYSKDGVIVMVMVVMDPNSNMSLEKGQKIPDGAQAIVVDVNRL